MASTAGQLSKMLKDGKAQSQAAAAAGAKSKLREEKKDLNEEEKEALKVKELAKIRQNELELALLNKAHRKI